MTIKEIIQFKAELYDITYHKGTLSMFIHGTDKRVTSVELAYFAMDMIQERL